jgi:diguanylate cyclase (GGDEF)-like protein
VSQKAATTDELRLWFDVNRRDIRDALTVLALATTVLVATAVFFVAKFVIGHGGDDRFQLLAMSAGLLVCAGLAVAFGVRRLQDLRHEILARLAAEQKAEALAGRDPLTHLANRQALGERLERALTTANTEHNRLAVLMLDLDGFRAINDRYGHGCGNQVLIEFAKRAGSIIGRDSLLARVGADEFAVLIPRIRTLDSPQRIAKRLSEEASVPFVIAGHPVSLGLAVGIAIAPDNGHTPDELLRRAELALHWAKGDGRSSTRAFKAEMDAHVVRRTQIERELRAAATEAIQVHYQPLVHLGDDRIVGFEALARWTDPDLGPIPPSVFIPVAEECGLINELGDQLLRTACRDAIGWPPHVTLAFNISPLQLREPTLGLRILAILGEVGLDPRRLEIEVTESALVENIEVAQRIIDQLRQAGVRIALDDFGTGYATLSQLLALHLDKIKIDRSFVQRLGKDNESMVIIRAIIGLAGGFGLTTTAEGVEEFEQLACLKAIGCIEGQGYLYGPAIPAVEVTKLLAAQRAAVA